MQVDSLYFHIPYKTLMENLDFILQNLINCEIFFDVAALDACKRENISLINSTFEKYGISKILHGPFMDLNLGSLDPVIREATYRRYEQTLELCRSLNADRVVFHSSFFPIYYEGYLKKWLKNAASGWERLLNKARNYGVTILIENSIDKTPKAILGLLGEIKDENFKACFDFGHYYIFGEKNGMEYIKEYPRESIGEVHLSDNNSKIDQHLALGKGILPILSFFNVLNELSIKPVITVEPHSIKDILVSRKYLKANRLI
ncbi:MAG: sugar phosphate isomerase/epimerase [Candidatus Omnitrophica bacterium]|nr:sugar phosphate isomerase/epimerase [Candidatus Omnitrophota bacterium]